MYPNVRGRNMSEQSVVNHAPSTASHFASALDIPCGTAGIVDGQYVWRGEDPSRVFIFFCGAVPARLLPQAPIFQRWKWVTKLRHPVVIAQDPLVSAQTGVELGWYVGRREGPDFAEILAPALRAARALSAGEICGLGSSGGAFAALMAVVHNQIDSALALNPQTNVLRYIPAMVDNFLRCYGCARQDLRRDDLDRMSVISSLWKYAEQGRVHVVINSADKLHHDKHVLPLCRAINDCGYEGFTFSRYTNEGQGHNPPSEQQTLWLMQKWWPNSIIHAERKHLMGILSLEGMAD